MELILILGPMKSGKSLELISYFAPLKYSNITYELFQPAANVRDTEIRTRNGIALKAKKISSLKEILKSKAKIVGIEEIHMFDASEVWAIEELVNRGAKVVIAGLDLDHQTRLMPIVKRLLEIVPTEVRYKRAVCEKCKSYNAVYTQVLKDGKPVPSSMPPSVPDDGSFEYIPVCRSCYVRAGE